MRNLLNTLAIITVVASAGLSSKAEAQIYHLQHSGGLIYDIGNLMLDADGELRSSRRVECGTHCMYYEGMGSTTEQWEQCLQKVRRLCKGLECNAMTVHAQLYSDPHLGTLTTVIPCQ